MNVGELGQRFRDYSEMSEIQLNSQLLSRIHIRNDDDDNEIREINELIRLWRHMSKGELIYQLIQLDDGDANEASSIIYERWMEESDANEVANIFEDEDDSINSPILQRLLPMRMEDEDEWEDEDEDEEDEDEDEWEDEEREDSGFDDSIDSDDSDDSIGSLFASDDDE